MAKILICDDQPDLRLLMQITLESEGHTTLQADGGRAVGELLDQVDDIDLMVLDVQMPTLDGWDVLHLVRAHAAYAELRVVMCTVKFSDADLELAWSLGCDGYVNKPFDLGELTGTVARVLDADSDSRQQRRAGELELLAQRTASIT